MPNDENNLITDNLVRDLLREKKHERRWKNIRFIFWFALFAYITFTFLKILNGKSNYDSTDSTKKHVALVRLDGMIAPDREFSAEEIIPVLNAAFKDNNAVGVVLDINSPGGTPVQASIIHDAILTLKQKYKKKMIVVGEDMLASGAYFIAVAGDKIYVNPNTITGSIGVIMKGFGFVEAMKKIGVERRVYFSGSYKDRLDPFLPQSAEDANKVKQIMDEVHNNFINAVIEGRKGKLQGDPNNLFNGDFWSGQTAYKLGLVDGLGNLMDVMDKEFQTTLYKEYGGMPNIFRILSGHLGTALDSLSYSG